MEKPITVKYRGNKVAMIFRKNLKVNHVQFFTDIHNPFQIGIHERPKNVKLPPHVHLIEKKLTIDTIQELLFVQSGKIKVSLITSRGEKIRDIILTGGDSILLMSEGHGVEFIEKSRIFEVKQGPYPGTTHAKIYLNEKH
jgi:hypothetical protein